MAAPTVSSVLIRLADRIPVKVLCIIALFIPLGSYMVEFHYLDMERHPPKRMCSPRYPEYSRVLDMSVVLPDGSVQAEGWVYPPDAVWLDSGVVHGCPCRVGPCIRPCCPNGFNKSHVNANRRRFKYLCSDLIDKEPEKSKPLRVLSLSKIEMVSVSRRHFPILNVNCKGGLHLPADSFLTTDGQVVIKRKIKDPEKHGICFGVWNDQLISAKVLVCSTISFMDDYFHLMDLRMAVLTILVLGSVTALLMVTLVMYLLAPDLFPAHCGGSFISYKFALLILKIIKIIVAWSHPFYPNIAEHLRGVMNSWGTSILMWQGLTVYHMWTTFNPHKLMILSANKSEGNTRFIYYSVAIWGSVVLITLWCLFKPGVVFLLYLQSLLLLITLGLTVSTLLRLRASLRASKVTQGPDSHRHNVRKCRSASLFLKFTFVTSLQFTLSFLLNNMIAIFNGTTVNPYFPSVYLLGLLTYLNDLWGAENFFIILWKKRTWEVLRSRLLLKGSS